VYWYRVVACPDHPMDCRLYYPDSPEDISAPDWPDRHLSRIMQTMRGNGWSIEGLARVFRLTPAGVELYLTGNDEEPSDR
jgi:hypothetical protein